MKLKNVFILFFIILSSPNLFAGAFESSKPNCIQLGSDKDMNIKWQAFKTPSRIGVWVDFTNFKRQGPNKAANIEELMLGQTISITAGEGDLRSGDEGRDFNIVLFFFANMLTKYQIRGTVSGVHDDRIDIDITMNNQTRTIPFSYQHSRNRLTLNGHVDVLDFDLGGPLGVITKNCGVHFGKTWSDVEIVISTPLTGC
jgi:hypothetical protein